MMGGCLFEPIWEQNRPRKKEGRKENQAETGVDYQLHIYSTHALFYAFINLGCKPRCHQHEKSPACDAKNRTFFFFSTK